MKLSIDYSEFFQRKDKILTNSEIEPFPYYSPSQRTNTYNIILINYRWDGELMFERGLCPLSNFFPFASSFAEAQKPLAAGEGSGLGLLLIIVVSYKKKPILRTLSTY